MFAISARERTEAKAPFLGAKDCRILAAASDEDTFTLLQRYYVVVRVASARALLC